MASKTREKMRWELEAETFASLLTRLSSDPHEAGRRYERLRERLILFFTRRLANAPEDLADQVIDRLARRLQDGEPVASVEAYALGIARHVVQEQRLVAARDVSPEGSLLENISGPDHTYIVEPAEEDRLLDAMEKCLARLPRGDAQLLSLYYLNEGGSKIEARRRLSEERNITQAALRKKVYQICCTLRDCIRRRTVQ
jgi:DNA-directed RNA polymerase specialized sigma24 family protein